MSVDFTCSSSSGVAVGIGGRGVAGAWGDGVAGMQAGQHQGVET